jgi:protein TonB
LPICCLPAADHDPHVPLTARHAGTLALVLALHVAALCRLQAGLALEMAMQPPRPRLVVNLLAPAPPEPQPVQDAPPPPRPALRPRSKPAAPSAPSAPKPPAPVATEVAAEQAPAVVTETPPTHEPVAAMASTEESVPEPAPLPPPPPEPVLPPRFDAAYLSNPAPAYPPLSRRMGEQGRVDLRVFVGEDGSAMRVEIQKGSGHARLDQAAVDAVKRWKFVPARRGSDAVAAWVLVPISFSLAG